MFPLFPRWSASGTPSICTDALDQAVNIALNELPRWKLGGEFTA